MTDTVDVELGSALSRSSGLGLSDMLIKAFDRQAAGRHPLASNALPAPIPAALPETVPSTSATPALDRASGPAAGMPGSAPVNPTLAPAPTASPKSSPEPGGLSDSRTGEVGEPAAAPVNPVLPEGRVTSNYGWRNDPFTGQVKFHSGTDVKMAYGQDVHSAADGKVSFVGEQSGYGLTVAIDHGNGVTTRYAHLSETTVRAGDSVNSGQVVARSGNSGRSTGPHLHFEVLENGRAIAPEAIGQLLH
jgi:murein DD-endopeptidase MepM/ murein hydrolase activator NlpD